MPPLKLFNSASCQIEPLHVENDRITLYVCGVTPYDTTHVGHAFIYVAYDVLVRFLRARGREVVYAQNVTDVDDDILRKAAEVGVAYDELARTETRRYLKDMRDLNVARPDHFVRATEVIPQILSVVQKLLETGSAYASGGSVYFDNRSFAGYGDLAHADRSRLLSLAQEHGGFPDDPNKRDPLDFVLWQAQKPGEPVWSGPLGPGRPGWHVECSTIATWYLGMPIDIHGGGRDLVFPHHSSEIAEAETFKGTRPFVRHWMHGGLVGLEGRKMSKSLGNIVFVRDLVRDFSPDAVRLSLLSHHYRQDWEFDHSEVERMQAVVRELGELYWDGGETERSVDVSLREEMAAALDDDLQTPQVVSMLIALIRKKAVRPLDAGELAAARWGRSVLGLQVGLA